MAGSRIEIEEFRIERFVEEGYEPCSCERRQPTRAQAGAKLTIKGDVCCRMHTIDGCEGRVSFEKTLAVFHTDFVKGKTTRLGQAKGAFGIELLKENLLYRLKNDVEFDPFYKETVSGYGRMKTLDITNTVTCAVCGVVYGFTKGLSDEILDAGLNYLETLKASNFPKPFEEVFPEKETSWNYPVIVGPNGERVTPSWYLEEKRAENDPLIKAIRKMGELRTSDESQLHAGKEEKPS